MAVELKLAQGVSGESRVALALDGSKAVTVDLLTGEVIWITPTTTGADLLIIVPATWYTDAGGLALDVYGAGFVVGSKVNFEGAIKSTVVAAATHLIGIISAVDVARAGVYAITVTGGGTPGPAYLTVIERSPQAGKGQLQRPAYDLLATSRPDGAGDTIRAIRGADDALRRISRN